MHTAWCLSVSTLINVDLCKVKIFSRVEAHPKLIEIDLEVSSRLKFPQEFWNEVHIAIPAIPLLTIHLEVVPVNRLLKLCVFITILVSSPGLLNHIEINVTWVFIIL